MYCVVTAHDFGVTQATAAACPAAFSTMHLGSGLGFLDSLGFKLGIRGKQQAVTCIHNSAKEANHRQAFANLLKTIRADARWRCLRILGCGNPVVTHAAVHLRYGMTQFCFMPLLLTLAKPFLGGGLCVRVCLPVCVCSTPRLWHRKKFEPILFGAACQVL